MPRNRIVRLLGALLRPADDPRVAADGSAALGNDALVAELRRSRAEIAQLRLEFEARAQLLPPERRQRAMQQVEELAEQERELLEAEHSLTLAAEERRAQQVLAEARYRAVEARLRSDEGD
jgi:hypothetical protein